MKVNRLKIWGSVLLLILTISQILPLAQACPPGFYGYGGNNYYNNWQPYAPYGAYQPRQYYAPPPPPYYSRPSSIVIAPSLSGIFGTGHGAGGYWHRNWRYNHWQRGW